MVEEFDRVAQSRAAMQQQSQHSAEAAPGPGLEEQLRAVGDESTRAILASASPISTRGPVPSIGMSQAAARMRYAIAGRTTYSGDIVVPGEGAVPSEAPFAAAIVNGDILRIASIGIPMRPSSIPPDELLRAARLEFPLGAHEAAGLASSSEAEEAGGPFARIVSSQEIRIPRTPLPGDRAHGETQK